MESILNELSPNALRDPLSSELANTIPYDLFVETV